MPTVVMPHNWYLPITDSPTYDINICESECRRKKTVIFANKTTEEIVLVGGGDF